MKDLDQVKLLKKPQLRKIILIIFTLPINIISYVKYHENFDVKL